MKYDKLLKRKRIIHGILFEAKAFHPTAFKNNIYAVSFSPKNKKFLLDKDIAFTQVTTKNNKEAIKKARVELDWEIEQIANRMKNKQKIKV